MYSFRFKNKTNITFRCHGINAHFIYRLPILVHALNMNSLFCLYNELPKHLNTGKQILKNKTRENKLWFLLVFILQPRPN